MFDSTNLEWIVEIPDLEDVVMDTPETLDQITLLKYGAFPQIYPVSAFANGALNFHMCADLLSCGPQNPEFSFNIVERLSSGFDHWQLLKCFQTLRHGGILHELIPSHTGLALMIEIPGYKCRKIIAAFRSEIASISDSETLSVSACR